MTTTCRKCGCETDELDEACPGCMTSLWFASARGSAARPITYRDLHEEASGMGLCASFFKVSNINPDAPVECNCKWDGGHEPTCDVVAAHALLAKRQNAEVSHGDRQRQTDDHLTRKQP